MNSSQRKKNGKPKRFEAHERKSLACQDKRIEGSPVEKAGLGSPEAAKGSGSLGHIA